VQVTIHRRGVAERCHSLSKPSRAAFRVPGSAVRGYRTIHQLIGEFIQHQARSAVLVGTTRGLLDVEHRRRLQRRTEHHRGRNDAVGLDDLGIEVHVVVKVQVIDGCVGSVEGTEYKVLHSALDDKTGKSFPT
jgi:hypothetical protein